MEIEAINFILSQIFSIFKFLLGTWVFNAILLCSILYYIVRLVNSTRGN